MKEDLKFFFENEKIFFKNYKLIFLRYLKKLTNFHYKKCKEYKKICMNLNYKTTNNLELDSLPFLPVNIFKNLSLKSIDDKKIVRIMRSSGTTGQKYSKIFLDEDNSKNQIKALNQLFYDLTKSKERLPMLVIDRSTILQDRENFSARSAAILGFSIFAKEITYALNEDMSLNIKAIEDFCSKYSNKSNIIFGFTYLIWKNFIKEMNIQDKLRLDNSIVIHGGGWKKLKKEKVSNQKFKELLFKKFNIKNVINYYGMVEQTGSIFFEQECGYFHTSKFSDIFIRDKCFKNLGFNKKGMIQLLSVLPTSYPGHNILTEDTGVVFGEDDCKCGKKGKYFKVFDRLEKSEVRGCGDAINK